MTENILICGDIHNEFKKLNILIDKKKPDILIQCGDFGYWPKEKDYQQLSDIKNKNTKILWCDGNHEDFESLKSLKNENNIFYMPRGSIYTLQDGRNILFFGGASSVDKCYRTPGKNWFFEENISYIEMENFEKQNISKVDIVISHTCPTNWLKYVWPKNYSRDIKADVNSEFLQYTLNMYKPQQWFFGHWHKYISGIDSETRTHWTCLNHINSENLWYTKL